MGGEERRRRRLYGLSAFERAARALPAPGDPRAAPVAIPAAPYPAGAPAPVSLAQLALLPRKPDWARGLRASWTPGEDGARKRLAAFIENGLEDYAESRDNPAQGGVSRLSPHLRFGEISPRQIVAAIREADAQNAKVARGADKFLSEILWREFNYHLLFSHPDAARANLQPRFDGMPWRDPPAHELAAWRRGRTGYPLVDAGMRELWATGYMHNRVRMVAASFLVKHLLIDWRIGEDWFWDTLCDADPANNPLNWQWVAGCGADAAPYFRIFNPVLQGEKFDPGGEYVRRWVPELAAPAGQMDPQAVAGAKGRPARGRGGNRRNLSWADRRPRQSPRAGAGGVREGEGRLRWAFSPCVLWR